MKKIIIAGAGLSGTVFGRILAEQGFEVEIHEKKNHLAGHIYDFKNKGIMVQKYGPHIFHTSKKEVISFVEKFWKLNNFKNRVSGYVNEVFVPIPFNFKSIDLCFPEKKEEIKKILLKEYPNRDSVPILELKENKNKIIKDLALFIYKNLFENYTTKMWGLNPNEIDKSVTARIPVILSYYDRYFKDDYEGVPQEGFTKAIENMLYHPNIKVILNSDVDKNIHFQKDKIIFGNEKKEHLLIYTGQIDALFSNKFGILDYRSLDIKFEEIKTKLFQDFAVVNYPADPKMTRITEFKNFYPEKDSFDFDYTIISKEFPGKYDPNSKIFHTPYYPLANNEAREKYNLYLNESKKYKNLFLLGRLARFKYINMDQAIEEAIEMANEIIEKEK